MARRTFFSFHYQADASRAWIVRNSWVPKVANSSRESAGFFDGSVFEAAQRESDESLKRFLREGLSNTSVTCVLVGAHTSIRRWVRYEILRSFVSGNGLLAVRIDSIKDFEGRTTSPGSNPFEGLAFRVDGTQVRLLEFTTAGWQDSRDVSPMPAADVRYDLGGRTNHTFGNLFRIFDWSDGGYDNIGTWIEQAASQAGR